MTKKIFIALLLLTTSIIGCQDSNTYAINNTEPSPQEATDTLPKANKQGTKIAADALMLTKDDITYDASYYVIPYPNGDVPKGKGVCTDVVIRTLRKSGIDLQREVHEDMQQHFSLYPKIWGRSATDKNIDHRRVPNLMVFFSRKGISKPITKNGEDYVPGDIVAWRLSSGQTHIGVVSSLPSKDGSHYKMVHNIGAGQVLEDCLFDYTIIGHYQYPK